jgi:nitronate monooxygenase
MRETALTSRFGLAAPIALAPMAGGPSTPALAFAVSEAGGFGQLGGQYLSLDRLRADIREVRAHTSKPFAVNLFADDGAQATQEQIASASQVLQKYRTQLGLPPLAALPRAIPLAESFAVLLEERVPAFSFTFGIPPASMLETCHERGIATLGTATCVAEARQLEAAGVDFIFAQGSGAGGHRGTFDRDAAPPLIGTMALVPQIASSVRTPVIAAGGIMDGRGVAAALALGACGASLGTAFLLCPEAGTSAAYRAVLKAARDDSTVLTRAFSGRWARGLENRFTREMQDAFVAPYAAQNGLTRDLRQAAARAGDAGLLSLWAGQGVPLAADLPAADLFHRLVAETAEVLAHLS